MNIETAAQKAGRASVRIAIIAALTMPGVVGALEMEAQFSAGVGYSDNINRSPTNPSSETIRTAGIDFNLEQETRKFEASVESTFNYLNYVDNTFDSEVIGGMIATANFAFVEERLLWLFQYNWGQQLQDLFQVTSPGNREDVHSLVTGPRLILPFGTRNALITDLEYTSTNYEFQPFDFESGAVIMQFGREVREGKTLSVNGSVRRFEFEYDQLFPTYDQTEAFVRWDSQSDRNVISLDVGYTQVDTDGESGDGMLFRANWNRNLSPRTELALAAGSQFSDQGNVFRFFQTVTQNLDQTNSIVGFGTPFRNNFLNAEFAYQTERTGLVAGAVVTSERYELVTANALDRDYYGLEVSLDRGLTRKIFVGGGISYRSIDYRFQSRTDTDRALDLDFGYLISPAFNVALQYQYLDRTSTDATSESSENRVMLRFGYVPSWAR